MDTLMEQMYVSIYIYAFSANLVNCVTFAKHTETQPLKETHLHKPFDLFLPVLIILPTQMEFNFLQQNHQIIQPKTGESHLCSSEVMALNVQETQAICSLDKVTPVTLAIRKDMRRSFVHHCEPRCFWKTPIYVDVNVKYMLSFLGKK